MLCNMWFTLLPCVEKQAHIFLLTDFVKGPRKQEQTLQRQSVFKIANKKIYDCDFSFSCICNSYVYPFFVWVKNLLHKKEYYLDPPTDCFDQLVAVAT